MSTGRTNRVLTHLRRLALRQERGVTDAQLLERFLARREEVAFAELVRRHGPMVLGVCRRVLGEPHAADDAFQATFLVLVRRAGSIVPRSALGPWLYGVARRTALKARGSAARRRRAEREAARARPRTTAPPAAVGDLRPVLDEELGRLPRKYSDPLVLCLLEGRSRKEAAGMLGWSEGTLSGRLARAKEQLGARLRRRGVTLAGAALAAALAERAATAEVSVSLVASTARAAVSLAGSGVSPVVISLTEEVLKAMLTSKIKAAAVVLVLVAGMGVGAGAISWNSGPAAEAAGPAQAGAEGKREAKPPAYVIEPPDILLVEYAGPHGDDPVKLAGQQLVRPGGTIGLGQLGAVSVDGLTVEKARQAIARHLASRVEGFDPRHLIVDVLAYNSKAYYVITEAADGTEQVHRLPATGNDTVLDALSQVAGPPAEAGKKQVWIARPARAGGREKVLPVDWKAITQDGQTETNYQLLPGDRLFVRSHRDAAPERDSDPARDWEAEALKAFRAARTPEERRQVVEGLEALARKLRDQLAEPGPYGK
jgi:RNA polymerase sigma factor (sigma-70 family)